jgi:hypothetical protein
MRPNQEILTKKLEDASTGQEDLYDMFLRLDDVKNYVDNFIAAQESCNKLKKDFEEKRRSAVGTKSRNNSEIEKDKRNLSALILAEKDMKLVAENGQQPGSPVTREMALQSLQDAARQISVIESRMKGDEIFGKFAEAHRLYEESQQALTQEEQNLSQIHIEFNALKAKICDCLEEELEIFDKLRSENFVTEAESIRQQIETLASSPQDHSISAASASSASAAVSQPVILPADLDSNNIEFFKTTAIGAVILLHGLAVNIYKQFAKSNALKGLPTEFPQLLAEIEMLEDLIAQDQPLEQYDYEQEIFLPSASAAASSTPRIANMSSAPSPSTSSRTVLSFMQSGLGNVNGDARQG